MNAVVFCAQFAALFVECAAGMISRRVSLQFNTGCVLSVINYTLLVVDSWKAQNPHHNSEFEIAMMQVSNYIDLMIDDWAGLHTTRAYLESRIAQREAMMDEYMYFINEGRIPPWLQKEMRETLDHFDDHTNWLREQLARNR